MSPTTTNRRTAIAGLCAAAAGAIFIGVQINHPSATVAHLLTTEMTLRETAKILMAVLALVGFTGMFASHRGRLGRLGHAGYGLLTIGYLAMFAAECLIGYYLPTVAHSIPGYVQHVINAAKALTDAGQFADACAKFAESKRLAPGLGSITLFCNWYARSSCGRVAGVG